VSGEARVTSTAPATKRTSWSTHPSKSSRYTNTPQWKRLRYRWLKANPECVRCGEKATHLDHRVPIAELIRRFGEANVDPFDEDNLQSLCRPCSNSKSGREGAAASARRRSPKRRTRMHPADALMGDVQHG
jgi:5-methylcytosine-specific restriction endonuclease McrA